MGDYKLLATYSELIYVFMRHILQNKTFGNSSVLADFMSSKICVTNYIVNPNNEWVFKKIQVLYSVNKTYYFCHYNS